MFMVFLKLNWAKNLHELSFNLCFLHNSPLSPWLSRYKACLEMSRATPNSIAIASQPFKIFQNLRVILHSDDQCIISGRQKATLKRSSLEHCKSLRRWSLLENHPMVNDKKGGNHKLNKKLNNFNGVHVFALQGCDPGSKTLFTLVLMQVYF